jgi:hypothetical protein
MVAPGRNDALTNNSCIPKVLLHLLSGQRSEFRGGQVNRTIRVSADSTRERSPKHFIERRAPMGTPDVRPVGDLPNEIGKTAARELQIHGITTLAQVSSRSKKELLAIHGVGPKAVRILGEALTEKGLDFQGG